MSSGDLAIIIVSGVLLCVCIPGAWINIRNEVARNRNSQSNMPEGFDKLTTGYPEYANNQLDFSKLSLVGTIMGTIFGIAGIVVAVLF